MIVHRVLFRLFTSSSFNPTLGTAQKNVLNSNTSAPEFPTVPSTNNPAVLPAAGPYSFFPGATPSLVPPTFSSTVEFDPSPTGPPEQATTPLPPTSPPPRLHDKRMHRIPILIMMVVSFGITCIQCIRWG